MRGCAVVSGESRLWRAGYCCTGPGAPGRAHTSLARPGDQPRDSGRVLPGQRLRIASSGEIDLAGPVLGRAILREGAAAPRAGPEGWHATGDPGRSGPDGGRHLTERRDRMVVSGGGTLHPEAIERAFADLPGVRQAAVFAVPDAIYGHRPVAFLRHGWPEAEGLTARMRRALERTGAVPRIAWPDRALPWPEDADGPMKPDRRHLPESVRCSTGQRERRARPAGSRARPGRRSPAIGGRAVARGGARRGQDPRPLWETLGHRARFPTGAAHAPIGAAGRLCAPRAYSALPATGEPTDRSGRTATR